MKITAPCLAVLLLAGCAPFASYPPIEVTSGLARPAFEPFPTLMAKALRYANLEYGDGSADFAYNLPEGATNQVYRMVAQKLEAGVPLREPGRPAFHLQSVRARGVEAEVDLIHPRTDGLYQLVTISLRNHLGKGWQVTATRPWNLHVTPPEPTFRERAEELVARTGSRAETDGFRP